MPGSERPESRQNNPPPRHAPGVPFPPYTYIPGHAPHPVTDPRGHSYGLKAPPPPPLFEPWTASETYRQGIDLFNHGYYWEAHEVWESLWMVAGRTGTTADFLKGLIKLAAAGVKLRVGNARGARRHLTRACELLQGVTSQHPQIYGLTLPPLIAAVNRAMDQLAAPPAPAPTSAAPQPIIVFEFNLQPVVLPLRAY